MERRGSFTRKHKEFKFAYKKDFKKHEETDQDLVSERSCHLEFIHTEVVGMELWFLQGVTADLVVESVPQSCFCGFSMPRLLVWAMSNVTVKYY